jgi:CRP-like cAMP-binding protein
MTGEVTDRLAMAVEKLSMVAGALLAEQLGELEGNVKAGRLRRCGFTNAEIARLLGITVNAANVALHRAERTRPLRRKAKR